MSVTEEKPYICQRMVVLIGRPSIRLGIFDVNRAELKKMKRTLLASCLWLVGVVSFAEELKGKVIAVLDGNTLEILADDNYTYKIMLYGIDCPELEQNFGEAARQLAEKIFMNKEVSVTLMGKDRWGTRLGIIWVKGNDPRKQMLSEGLAWTAERNPEADLEQVKEQAREKRLGLWSEEEPVAPWVFRRQQTMLVPKSS